MLQENANDSSVDEEIVALSDMAWQYYQESRLRHAQDACHRILRH
jgi:hypothetical protein